MDNNKTTASTGLVWLILFLEGFVSVSLQVIFIRQLTPFVGSDVVIVGIVIGIFLAALSLGYYRGGLSEDPKRQLFRNLLLSSVWVSVACSYMIMAMAFPSQEYLAIPYLNAVLYLLVGMSPVVYWLGQTIPLLTNLIKQSTVSRITGTALSINTVGSVFGAVITPIILFWLIGVGATIVVNVFLLVTLTVLSRKLLGKGKLGYNIILLPIALISAPVLNIEGERLNFIKTTSYANYDVVEQADEYGNHSSVLRLNNTSASALENGNKTSYVRFLYDFMIDHLDKRDHDVLVLGSGGFTFSIQDDTKNRYSYVDIDPSIKDVAEKFFLKYEIKGDFIAQDARQFIKHKKSSYDVIFVDLFSSNVRMPWHVTTKEFMTQVADGLRQEGYAFFNVIHDMNFDNKANLRLYSTIHSVFDYCHQIPLLRGKQKYANVVLVCKKPDGKPVEINVDDRQLW